MIARDHHYLFSHVHLRNQALRSPDKLLGELQGPMREGFLFFLWQQVEEVAATKVNGAGLTVAGVDTLGGGTLALVQMPPPEKDTESLFAAVFLGAAGARYFVFDRAAGDPDQATLAELELDDTRINLGRHPANQAALLDALSRELTTPRPPSVRPTAPTVAMAAGSVPPPGPGYGSQPGVSQPGVSQPGVSMPGGPVPPQAKKKSLLLALIAFALGAPLFCCIGTGIMAYDSGLDAEAGFTAEATLSTDAQDHERLTITLQGPEEINSYRVVGPGAEQCDYIYRYGHGSRTCEVSLDTIADPTPSYHVVARGHGPQFFGENVGDSVELQTDLEIARPLGLRWSEAAQTTVVSGFPGRLEVTDDGFIRLLDAPPGTTVMVAGQTSGAVDPMVALDVAALTNQVGARAVLRDGGRVSLENVSVRMPDGTTASGTAPLNAADLRPALLSRLSELGNDGFGAATGSAILWIEDGRVRELRGAAQTLADLGRIVLTQNREAPAGRCGPYSLYGVGIGHRVQRLRWMTTVEVYDRVEDRRVARRRFRGDRPSCPYSIQTGTDQLHGTRDTVRADAYAREHLAPPTE